MVFLESFDSFFSLKAPLFLFSHSEMVYDTHLNVATGKSYPQELLHVTGCW